VTDPSQQLDAVLVFESWGAAAGGIDWYVCIVAKGPPISTAKEAILVASDIRQPNLAWRQPHLLQFEYERAMILDFTNLWGSNTLAGRRRFSGGDPYWVELRLAPSKGPSSLIAPDSGFI
jgi:hypothetical protein